MGIGSILPSFKAETAHAPNFNLVITSPKKQRNFPGKVRKYWIGPRLCMIDWQYRSPGSWYHPSPVDIPFSSHPFIIQGSICVCVWGGTQ